MDTQTRQSLTPKEKLETYTSVDPAQILQVDKENQIKQFLGESDHVCEGGQLKDREHNSEFLSTSLSRLPSLRSRQMAPPLPEPSSAGGL